MLVHSVYFWLKSDLSDADKKAFREGLESLATIACTQAVYVGTPAPTVKRPIIDSSYDFGLTVLFTDMAAHDQYQVHPTHKAFVANHSTKWDKLRIFDAI